MAFDVVMFGSLSVPERNVEEWLAGQFDVTEFPWLEEVGGVDVPHDTPEALMSLLGEVTCAPHELFEVTLADGKLTVQCYVSEDTFRATNQALALLFASSAAYGGLGELCFTGYQGIRFGERLVVRAARATYSKVTGIELAKLEQQKSFQSLDAKIHERFDSLVGREATTTDLRRSKWVINPFTGRKVRVADDSVSR